MCHQRISINQALLSCWDVSMGSQGRIAFLRDPAIIELWRARINCTTVAVVVCAIQRCGVKGRLQHVDLLGSHGPSYSGALRIQVEWRDHVLMNLGLILIPFRVLFSAIIKLRLGGLI
jgi:hypothetical protein